MGEYTGKYRRVGFPYYEKCECGNPKGIEVISMEFDSEHLDSLKHDGEIKEERIIVCPVCKIKK